MSIPRQHHEPAMKSAGRWIRPRRAAETGRLRRLLAKHPSGGVARVRASVGALALWGVARRVLAVVVVASVALAGVGTVAAADDSEGFVDAETFCLEAAEPFEDVDVDDFASDAVGCLYLLGIVWGRTSTWFDPDSELKRSELAALIARAWRGADRECPEDQAPFSDIARNWARADIDCVWALGATASSTVTAAIEPAQSSAAGGDRTAVLASGPWSDEAPADAADALFSPGGVVTNTQFAVMVANAWLAAGFSCDRYDSVNFTDVDYNSDAGSAIHCLQMLGVLPLDWGTQASTTFQPDAPIARGDAAVLIARLWRKVPPPPPPDPAPVQQLTSQPGQQEPEEDPVATAPATPAAPALTVGDTVIDATWTAPDDGGSPITHYDVRHRATGTNKWDNARLAGSSTLSLRLDLLTNGTEYEVQIQAANAVGDSGWSPSSTATPAAPVVVPPATGPAAPAAPALTAGNAIIGAAWAAPSDGGSAITGYRVRHRATGVSISSDTSWTISGVLGADTLTHKIYPLTNDTEYEVQVQATNAVGDSGWSPSSTDTPRPAASAPAQPDAPSLTAGNAKLTANWTAPADNGSAITGYKVRHRAAGALDWTTSNTLGSSTTSYEIGSLTNGTRYKVQVQAANSAGDSEWSDSAQATPYTVPSKPTKVTLTAGNAKLTATWTAPADNGSAITGYTIRHRATGATDWTTSNSQTGTSYEIGSLTNGTEYEVQVQAASAAGDSGWSDSVKATPAAVPDAPGAPTLTAGAKKITATWTAPSNGGSSITGYKVRHRATGTSSWSTSSSQTGTSKEIASLTNGTEYEVQVQASNNAGDSGWSRLRQSHPAHHSVQARRADAHRRGQEDHRVLDRAV